MAAFSLTNALNMSGGLDLSAAAAFLRDIKPGGPWTLVCASPRQGHAFGDVATFRRPDDAASWARRHARRSPALLLPETSASLSRPVFERDLVATRFIAVELRGDALALAPRLTALPPSTVLLNSGRGLVAIWRLQEAMSAVEGRTIAERLANAVGGSPSFFAPIPGVVRPQANRPCILLHLRRRLALPVEALATAPTAAGAALEPRRSPSGFAAPATAIEAVSTPWIWPNAFPAGAISLLSGQPGAGKTAIACSIAATVSSGGFWPSGERAQQGCALVLEAEAPAADTRNRLAAAGADLARVDVRGLEQGAVDLSGDGMEALAAHAAARGDVRLLVLSPLLSFFGRASTDDTAVRQKLAPLLGWAAREDVGILGILHPAKNSGQSLDAQFAGADAFRRACRAAFVATTDASDDEPNVKLKRRVMVCAKSNVARDDFRALYRVATVELPGGVSAPTIEWLAAGPAQPEAASRPAQTSKPSRPAGRKSSKLKGDTGDSGDRGDLHERASPPVSTSPVAATEDRK